MLEALVISCWLDGQTPAMMDIPRLFDGASHVMQMNPVWKLETFCSTINLSLDFRIPEPPHKQLWPFLAEDFVSWRNVQSDGFIEVQFMRTQSSPLF